MDQVSPQNSMTNQNTKKALPYTTNLTDWYCKEVGAVLKRCLNFQLYPGKHGFVEGFENFCVN